MSRLTIGIAIALQVLFHSLTAAEAPPVPILSMQAHEIAKNEQNKTGRTLVREIYRQAFLIAARDGSGLRTRDDSMGELLTDKKYTLLVATPSWTKVEVQLTGANKKESVWQLTHDLKGNAKLSYMPHIVAAEEASRGKYIEACKKMGFSVRPHPKANTAVPDWLSGYINRMNTTCCFLAIRKLHEISRRDGESPAILCQLSRCYADMGSMTEFFWNAIPKACAARSLIYAQRAVSLYPENIEAEFTLAYSMGVIGMPAEALETIAAARKKLSGDKKVPEWIELVEALCKYDMSTLAAHGDNGRAQYFRFLAGEFSLSREELVALGEKVVSVIPDCYRVHERLSKTGGVGYKHKSTTAGIKAITYFLYPRLSQAKILPDKLAPILSTLKDRASVTSDPSMKIIDVLVNAGKDDDKELSWTFLGRTIHESWYHLILRRAMFMEFSWNVENDDFLNGQKLLTSAHQYGKFIDSYSTAYRRSRKDFHKDFRTLKLEDVSTTMSLLVNSADRVYRGKKYWDIASWHDDLTRYNIDSYIDARGKYAKHLLQGFLKTDPYNVHLVNATFVHNKDLAKKALPEWKKRFSAKPTFMSALADFYLNEDPDKAIPLYEDTLRVSPGTYSAYRKLASIYKQRGDIDQWRVTLERYLAQPDVGLQHAQIRVDIAKEYMKSGQNEKALPYAERAAGTWAGWAMDCASKCNAKVGKMDKAELWIRRVSERYAGSEMSWYCFCQTYGRGDIGAARGLVEEKLTAQGRPGGSMAFYFHLMEGNTEEAAKYLEQGYARNKQDIMMIMWQAITALQKGESEKALTFLDSGVKLGDKYKRHYPIYKALGDLAKVISSWVKNKAGINVSDGFGILGEEDSSDKVIGLCFMGKSLAALGMTKQASETFRRLTSIQGYDSSPFKVLGFIALRKAGVAPEKTVKKKDETPNVF